MAVRKIVKLRGRVQGVGFRDRILDIAQEYPVAGSVRNVRADQSVEIDVEGREDDVDRFLAEVLARAPTFARITGVERTSAAPCGLSGFTRAASA